MKGNFILLLLLVTILIICIFNSRKKEGLSDYNKNLGERLLRDLAAELENIEDVTEEDLKRLKDRILAVFSPKSQESEAFSFFYPANYTYWPQYFTSGPYTDPQQDPWVPGLFTRLTNWEPGFSSGSGWSMYYRPGVYFDKIQRSRWVKNNGKYYFINNGGLSDRMNDYYKMH